MFSKNKVCAFLLALILVPIQMFAVPALPVAKRIMVGNEEYYVSLRGDEFGHYWQAETGEKIIQQEDGRYRILSHFEAENLLYKTAEGRRKANATRNQNQHGFLTSLIGSKRGLVILVDYRDQRFSLENPTATYNEIFNQLDYKGYGMTGSVRDYFLAQSYGKFDMTLDVAGPYTLSKPMASYGGNSEEGIDIGARAFARESFMLADPDVDYKNYDWDGDGVVEQVFIVYAGYAEAQGGPAYTIWPHSFELSDALKLDGVAVSKYACSSELRGASGKNVDGIGTVCHEFSHCLGLMDHYDTSGSNFGTGPWDLMASGSYNNNSCTPAAYTAFERWCMGWLEPIELTSQTDIKDMKPLVESPEAYILYNDAHKDEFYILENRQKVGFDAGLYGHGLMVFHIDYNEQDWMMNTVNVSAARQRVTIIPADGELVSSRASLQADPFPGTKGTTALTDFTNPAARVYNAINGSNMMGKPIESIKEDANGLVSFKALYPRLDAPEPTFEADSYDPSAGTFAVTWPAVPHAKTYELEVTEYAGKKTPEEARVLEEDFAGTYKATAGFSDIGSKLSDYLSNRGFSGKSLFQSPDKLRFGTGTTNGSLQSPVFNVLSTARFTLVLKVKPYTDGTKVTGKVNVVTEVSNGMNIPFEFTEEGYLLLYPTANVDTRFYFNIQPVGRMYLSYLALYDGEYTAEELGLEASSRTRAGAHKTTTYSTDEPRYVFEGVNPASRYDIIVRAIDGDRYSPWSEICSVSLTTGISELKQNAMKQDDVYYDIKGRRILSPIRGNLYIRNGRKVIY